MFSVSVLFMWRVLFRLFSALSWTGQSAWGAHQGGGGGGRGRGGRGRGHGLRRQGGGVQGARREGRRLPSSGGGGSQQSGALSVPVVRVGRDGLRPGAEDDLHAVAEEEQEDDDVRRRGGRSPEEHPVSVMLTWSVLELLLWKTRNIFKKSGTCSHQASTRRTQPPGSSPFFSVDFLMKCEK